MYGNVRNRRQPMIDTIYTFRATYKTKPNRIQIVYKSTWTALFGWVFFCCYMYVYSQCRAFLVSRLCVYFSVDYKNLSRHLMHTNVSKNIKPYYKAIYNTPLPSHGIISQLTENPKCAEFGRNIHRATERE